jgi:hypothetical protein
MENVEIYPPGLSITDKIQKEEICKICGGYIYDREISRSYSCIY